MIEVYYEALTTSTHWYGVVYEYDETGEGQTYLFKGPMRETEGQALDDASEFCEEKCINAKLA